MRYALLLLLLIVSTAALAQYYDPNPVYDIGLPGTQGPIDPHLFYLETGMTPGDWNKLSNSEKEKISAQVQCNEIHGQIDEQLALEQAGHVGFYNWRSLREIENRKTACGGMTYRLSESPNDTYPAEYAKQQTDMRGSRGIPPVPYPESAMRMGHQGTVMIKVDVAADGSVSNPSVYKSSGYRELDRAALLASSQWKLDPAKGSKQGVPITFSLGASH